MMGSELNEEKYNLVLQKQIILGKRNWILPLAPFQIPEELPECENLNEKMVTFYSENDAEQFNIIIENIKTNLKFEHHIQAIEQAIKAYNARDYYACCYTLAPFVEGILAHNSPNKNCMKSTIFFERTLRQSDARMLKKGYLLYGILLALEGFLHNYNDHASFEEGIEPEYLNRHWMAHGRMEKEICQYHCLQLFGAIWALTELLHYNNSDKICMSS
jgi:hypothetical protein